MVGRRRPLTMILLSLHDLDLRRDERDLLRVASLDLAEGMRLGLVGANGSGKSTLLAAMAGALAPADGRVVRPPGVEVTLLTQSVAATPRVTLWDLARAELASLDALARDLERARPGAEDARDADAGLRYAELLAAFDQRGGFTADARLRVGLARVGVPESSWHRAAEAASGGERQRARLVGTLTAPSDVLLLDEPSNHLDLTGRAWLAEQLLGRRGAVVIASHDRALLDRVCSHVARIEAGQLVMRRGGYTEVAERVAGEDRGRGRREAARARRVAELERMAAELARFGHRGAATRRRRAERERAALLAESPVRADTPVAAPRDASRGAPTHTGGRRAGVLLRARHLRVEGVLDDAHLTLTAAQRVALVGPSGSGKSTVLALVAGARESDDARAVLAWEDGTSLLYLDQVARGLDPERSAEEVLRDWVPAAQAAGALAAAGLPHAAWRRPCGSLSGGERARAALALVSVRDADVVVLDEPTNDLDLPGIEALEALLRASRACIVLASHDEALVRALDAEVCAVEAGALVRYRGGIDGYRRGSRRVEPTVDTGALDAATGDGAAIGSSGDAITHGEPDEAALEAELRAAEAALEDPLRLSERERERWRARRAAAEAALVARADAALPAPAPRFRTREAGTDVTADRDGDALLVRLADGPAVHVRRVGRVAHLAPLPGAPGAEHCTLPWAWRALCRGAARLALYLLPVDAVQVSSAVALAEAPFVALGDSWWVARRGDLERDEGWIRAEPLGEAPRRERRGRRRRGGRDRNGPHRTRRG